MDWEYKLAETGYRVTGPRRAVMEVLLRAEGPLSPCDILSRGQQFHQSLGLVTVYRALDLFAELGLVRKAHAAGGCHGYMLSSPGHHHAVICRGCARAVEFRGDDDLQSLIERVEVETGFQVQGHLLQLFGLCQDCQNRQS